MNTTDPHSAALSSDLYLASLTVCDEKVRASWGIIAVAELRLLPLTPEVLEEIRNERSESQYTKKPRGQAGRVLLLCRYRSSAKKRGYTFALTPEAFAAITSKVCAYCGSPPNSVSRSNDPGTTAAAKEWGSYVYNGIDRVDSAKGYTADNVVACCTTCNKAKMVMSQPEFLAWVERVYKHSVAKAV